MIDNESMTYSVIIVAGGKGLRMGGELPKQFIPIAGKPVLMHTIAAFFRYNKDLQIILVLPKSHREYWSKLCKEYNFSIKHTLVDGGETRFHSVSNGLAVVRGEIVGIHDGVRPFVSQEVIERCYRLAKSKKAVIPVVDIVETVRKVNKEDSVTVNRNEYKLVQTPQVFQSSFLKEAYKQPYSSIFTDDASVVEELGCTITLTEGNRENIKITTPFDLKIAATLI